MKKLLVLLFVLTGCTNIMNTGREDKIIVAHRGGAELGAENTLTCIRKGIEAGAGWIEIDVHLSRDGEIVVCHDDAVDRTTNGEGHICDMTYEQIRALKVVDEDGNETGDHIPTLHEVLELINGKAFLLLEIKHTKHSLEGIEKACVDCIKEHGMVNRVVIQSFDDDVLETVYELMPALRLEKLLFVGMPFGFDFDDYDYVSSFNVYHKLVSDKFIAMAHARGQEVKVWTLNKYKADLVSSVDGIITNNPALFIK